MIRIMPGLSYVIIIVRNKEIITDGSEVIRRGDRFFAHTDSKSNYYLNTKTMKGNENL